MVALSVDSLSDSANMISRMGLSFVIGSDPDQEVVKAFRVQNPETKELALHAVYIVDREGRVYYRKVARRRPTSIELIDAIDAYHGNYPSDEASLLKSEVKRDVNRKRIAVAYPQNIFQAIIEISEVTELPETISSQGAANVYSQLLKRKTDDSLIAFRSLVRASVGASQEELLQAATWLVREVFYSRDLEVFALGGELKLRINRVRQLEQLYKQSQDATEKDKLLEQLAGARAGLSVARASVSKKAGDWQLNFAKAMLRSYREVALAASRSNHNKID